jgi:signal peptidase I
LSDALGEGTPTPGGRTGGNRSMAGARDLIGTLLVAVILALLVRTFVIESFVVEGVSMEPTFLNGEHVLVDKTAFWLSPPKTGEIIVFKPPIQDPTEDYIKRVIATAGETVGIRNGNVYVDGHELQQPYIEYWDPTSFHTVRVPKGDVFVLGDNRPDSYDSRYFGPVPIPSIAGQVVFAFWPLSRLGTVGQPEPGSRGYRA